MENELAIFFWSPSTTPNHIRLEGQDSYTTAIRAMSIKFIQYYQSPKFTLEPTN